MAEVTQTISELGEIGHRGVDSRDDFVIKTEAVFDQLHDSTITEMNTAFSQINKVAEDISNINTDLETFSDEKITELNSYTGDKKTNLDDYADTKKDELNAYKNEKKDELDDYAELIATGASEVELSQDMQMMDLQLF